MILGLPESQEPAESDTVRVKEFAERIGVESEAITETFRDGPRSGNKPRILKVRFADSRSRSAFLREFRSVSPAPSCWVRPDLSFHQRERDRELRKELDSKNGRVYQNGRVTDPGSNLYFIHKKQVCLRSEVSN